MAIEDMTPFGGVPDYYQGLLGADETAALQKRAQLQGLLGAGATLTQGMSSYGPRRSALQNILSAVAGGFQATGGAYEGALKNLQNEQQIKQMQLKQQQAQNQITGLANAKNMYPDLAPLADIDPQEFVKAVVQRQEAERARERMSNYEKIGQPTQQPEAQVAPQNQNIQLYGDMGEAPQNAIATQQPQLTQLEQNKRQADLYRLKQKEALLNKDTEAARYFGDMAEQLYPKNSFIRVGNDLVSTADMKPVYTAPEKPEEFTGNLGNLSLQLFGTRDPSKLNPQQNAQLKSEATRLGIGEGQKINVYTGQLSKPTVTKVEEQQLNTGDQIARLNNIQFSYRPEFLNPKFRATQEWNTLKDKFGKLNDQEKAQLGQFSQYKQNAVQNLNLTIKDLTGASMGENEAKRIISTLPNPGMGVLDGDSPTEFKAKLDNAVQQTKYSLARKQYALKNGLKWENISLDQMPTIVNKRAAELAKQYKLDPTKEADKNTIKTQLAAEFGIAF